MATTKADATYTCNGLTIKQKFTTWTAEKFTTTNPIKWIVIHNTNTVEHSNTSQSAQYCLAQYNHNLGQVAVHYYVDDKEIWHCLPDSVHGWHAADERTTGGGNMCGIAIEIVEDVTARNVQAEERGAKLAATLIHNFGLTIDALKQHNDFYSKKNCPAVIRKYGWSTFKAKVQKYLDELEPKTTKTTTKTQNETKTTEMYRIRKTWADASSQIGAYASLTNAKKACKEGYSIYNSKGVAVYTIATKKKSVTEIAKEVLAGKWGNGETRKKKLKEAGYNYEEVQKAVNKLLK